MWQMGLIVCECNPLYARRLPKNERLDGFLKAEGHRKLYLLVDKEHLGKPDRELIPHQMGYYAISHEDEMWFIHMLFTHKRFDVEGIQLLKHASRLGLHMTTLVEEMRVPVYELRGWVKGSVTKENYTVMEHGT